MNTDMYRPEHTVEHSSTDISNKKDFPDPSSGNRGDTLLVRLSPYPLRLTGMFFSDNSFMTLQGYDREMTKRDLLVS